MKKIAIIIQKLRGGGAERVAANLSIEFAEDHEVHLIVFDGSEIKYPYGGRIHDLGLPPRKSKMGKVLNLIQRSAAVRRLKKQYAIDCSISLMEGANLVNVLSHRTEKVITSIRIHLSSARFKSLVGKYRSIWITRFTSKRSTWIVALSEGVRRDLIRSFGVKETKIRTIYNHCDGSLLLRAGGEQENLDIPVTQKTVTTMGRFTHQKGQWHLLRAFRRVVDGCPDARLILFGDGPLRGELMNLTKELGLEPNVTFPGFVEGPHRSIAASRAFAFPSLYEGLGNVVVEAIACGVPVVSTDCYSGPREILDPNTEVQEHLASIHYGKYGILTTVGNMEHFNAEDPLTVDEIQLADAILRLLTEESCYQYYKEQAQIRSRDFLPNTIMEQWNSIL